MTIGKNQRVVSNKSFHLHQQQAHLHHASQALPCGSVTPHCNKRNSDDRVHTTTTTTTTTVNKPNKKLNQIKTTIPSSSSSSIQKHSVNNFILPLNHNTCINNNTTTPPCSSNNKNNTPINTIPTSKKTRVIQRISSTIQQQQQQQREEEEHVTTIPSILANNNQQGFCLILDTQSTSIHANQSLQMHFRCKKSYKDYTTDDIAQYFHLPIKEVAISLGVSVTFLKKVCRRLNISRWPYRKVSSLHKKMTTHNNNTTTSTTTNNNEQEQQQLEEQQICSSSSSSCQSSTHDSITNSTTTSSTTSTFNMNDGIIDAQWYCNMQKGNNYPTTRRILENPRIIQIDLDAQQVPMHGKCVGSSTNMSLKNNNLETNQIVNSSSASSAQIQHDSQTLFNNTRQPYSTRRNRLHSHLLNQCMSSVNHNNHTNNYTNNETTNNYSLSCNDINDKSRRSSVDYPPCEFTSSSNHSITHSNSIISSQYGTISTIDNSCTNHMNGGGIERRSSVDEMCFTNQHSNSSSGANTSVNTFSNFKTRESSNGSTSGSSSSSILYLPSFNDFCKQAGL